MMNERPVAFHHSSSLTFIIHHSAFIISFTRGGTLVAVDKNEFRAALGRFASGVTVVTALDAGGRPQGLTVSAFCSVSLVPPLVLVSVEKGTRTHDALAGGGAASALSSGGAPGGRSSVRDTATGPPLVPPPT
jgi:hypothetical protein